MPLNLDSNLCNPTQTNLQTSYLKTRESQKKEKQTKYDTYRGVTATRENKLCCNIQCEPYN